jgi:pimeloyl-ACP methyl ester carboxylesterase/DNA-binding winged helix-turn-helix (wHTH) protein
VWQARFVVFTFDDLELDLSLFELRRDGVRLPLEPQVFSVLAYLLAHRDRVVSKEELMDEVWGGRFVSEAAVTSRIKQARRAVGDDGQAQRVIRTVHRRGYRFVAAAVAIREVPAPDPAAVVRGEPVPRSRGPVRYAVTDGLHIAYQVSGAGTRDIVLVPGFVSHLEFDWADPRHAHFLDRLAGSGRLVRFDKRGTGMSDRPDGLPDLETRMHDVLAVMDAAGSRRAVLFGYSEGGPMATLFAAAHPDRVEALILYGAYAKRLWSPDYPWAPTEQERARYVERLATSWSWEADLRVMCPSADDEMARWWGRRARAAATPSTVRSLIAMNTLVDVRDVLAAVRVPTLVLHRRGDRDSLLEEGRYLAEHIPGGSFVELPGADHFVAVDPDQILDRVEAFLADVPSAAPPVLALAAILAPGGDPAGPVADGLAAAGGRPGRTPEGRPVVVFDGPATAIRCAVGYLDAHPDVGVGLGLHVTEVTRQGERIGGYGVSTAVALADMTPVAEVWASATVRGLVAGSGLVLEP